MNRRISADAGAFMLEWARRRSVDFDTIAALTRERFPKLSGIDAGAIAAYVGRHLGGRSSLDRLAKDREVATWLRAHKDGGRVADIRAACVAQFGAHRVPSVSRIAEFLRTEGRAGRQNRARILDRDPELVEWLNEQLASKRTLTDLRKECLARFGPSRTPAHSALWRLVKTIKPGQRPRPLKVVTDDEMATWLRANAPRRTLQELRSEAIAVFGEQRVPSISAIHRYLARLSGPKLTRKKGTIDRDPELAAWIWTHRFGRTLDEMTREAIAVFGPARAPSRSGLHRYLMAARRGAFRPPEA